LAMTCAISDGGRRRGYTTGISGGGSRQLLCCRGATATLALTGVRRDCWGIHKFNRNRARLTGSACEVLLLNTVTAFLTIPVWRS